MKTLREDGNVKMEAQTGVMLSQARNTWGYQPTRKEKVKSRKEGFSLEASKGNVALPTARFRTSSLQNCVKTRSVWYFVMVAPGNENTYE